MIVIYKKFMFWLVVYQMLFMSVDSAKGKSLMLLQLNLVSNFILKNMKYLRV